jgi:hypothetical protein
MCLLLMPQSILTALIPSRGDRSPHGDLGEQPQLFYYLEEMGFIVNVKISVNPNGRHRLNYNATGTGR